MGWGHGGDGDKAIIAGLEWGQIKYGGAEMGTILLPRGGGGEKNAPRATLYSTRKYTAARDSKE